MKFSEIFKVLFFAFIVSSILTLIIASTSFTIFLALFVFSSFIFLVISRYFFYTRPLGQYQLSPFALVTEFGRWKITDPYAVEAPVHLHTKPMKIKIFNKHTGELEQDNVKLELNFKTIWTELITKNIREIFPRIEELDFLKIENKEQKDIIRKAIIDYLVYFMSLDVEPKLYEIVSATNNLVIFWFGNSQPAEYGLYRTKQFYKKWNIVPAITLKGMPVVEAFGVVLKDKITLEEDTDFDCLLCLPIFDEQYRKMRSLNLAKYERIADSLATMAQKFNQALPTLDYIELTEAEKDRALREKEVMRSGVMNAYTDVSTLSVLYTDLLSQVSTALGKPASSPEMPQETKQTLENIKKKAEEGKSRIDSLKEQVSKLTKEAEPKQSITPEKPTEGEHKSEQR